MKVLAARFKYLSASHGFTLVEVVVFVSVLSVALVSLLASISYSSLLLYNAQHKVVATRRAEELAEWLKFQREYYGFAQLDDQIDPDDSTSFCFNNEEVLAWPDESGDCSGYALDNFYKREALLTRSGSVITAQISVSWQTLGNIKEVSIITKYHNYGL